MKRVQIYAVDADGSVVHAGTRNMRSITRPAVLRAERSWNKWRAKYLADNPGDYPLRHCAAVSRIWAGDVSATEGVWFEA